MGTRLAQRLPGEGELSMIIPSLPPITNNWHLVNANTLVRTEDTMAGKDSPWPHDAYSVLGKGHRS